MFIRFLLASSALFLVWISTSLNGIVIARPDVDETERVRHSFSATSLHDEQCIIIVYIRNELPSVRSTYACTHTRMWTSTRFDLAHIHPFLMMITFISLMITFISLIFLPAM